MQELLTLVQELGPVTGLFLYMIWKQQPVTKQPTVETNTDDRISLISEKLDLVIDILKLKGQHDEQPTE